MQSLESEPSLRHPSERRVILPAALPKDVLAEFYIAARETRLPPSSLLQQFVMSRWADFHRKALPALWASRYRPGQVPGRCDEPLPMPGWWQSWKLRNSDEIRRLFVAVLTEPVQALIAEALYEEERIFWRASFSELIEAFFASEWDGYRKSLDLQPH